MVGMLHTHTVHSDGVKTVDEINALALTNNIDVVAITDHDSVNAYYDIVKLHTSVRFIIGVEMNVKYNGENIHILGYFNEINDNILNFFKELSDARYVRAKKMVENLRKYFNIDIKFEDVCALAQGNIGRPHIAKVLCDKLNISKDEVFLKYIGKDSIVYEDGKSISLEEGLQFLKENNALISLAHPIQIKTFDYDKILDMGFDAVEAYRPDQDGDYTKKVIYNACKHNLALTGGSDYHGHGHHAIFSERVLADNDLDYFLEVLESKKSKSKIYYDKH